MNSLRKGFTLIELLVVIAVLGVLAAVVIVAINPLAQLAKTRDAGRLNSISQMGNALVALGTSNAGAGLTDLYPTAATWVATLNGEMGTAALPSAVPYSYSGASACATNVSSNWCYRVSAASPRNQAIVYAKAESPTNTSKCAAGTVAYYVFSAAVGRSGGVCYATEAGIPIDNTIVFTF